MKQAWPHPRIIAHRGGGALAPENTLAGLRKARSLGFGAVEFDVMLSADSVPVLMHDETVDRTTDGRGSVAALPYADLARFDAGAGFAPEYRGEHIPRFDEAAKMCVELGLWANVEIKPSRGQDAETGRIAAVVAERAWPQTLTPPLLSSFSEPALEAARAAAPRLPRGLLVDEVPRDWRQRLVRLECLALHCNARSLTPQLVHDVREAGYGLLCWTVNDPEFARQLLQWGVDAIFSDRLDRIRPEFA
jgi:glycerophosphoryl diester phosphodiesterase